MAEKKPTDKETEPSKTMLFVALGLIVLGSSWFVYETWLRPRTADELAVEKEDKKIQDDIDRKNKK